MNKNFHTTPVPRIISTIYNITLYYLHWVSMYNFTWKSPSGFCWGLTSVSVRRHALEIPNACGMMGRFGRRGEWGPSKAHGILTKENRGKGRRVGGGEAQNMARREKGGASLEEEGWSGWRWRRSSLSGNEWLVSASPCHLHWLVHERRVGGGGVGEENLYPFYLWASSPAVQELLSKSASFSNLLSRPPPFNYRTFIFLHVICMQLIKPGSLSLSLSGNFFFLFLSSTFSHFSILAR